jgi:hypothetical protein
MKTGIAGMVEEMVRPWTQILIAVILLALVPCSAFEAGKVAIQKRVTESANFVLYLPKDWTCSEKTEGDWLTVSAVDPTGKLRAEMVYAPGGRGGRAQTALVLAKLGRLHPGLRISNSMRSKDYSRVVFDGFYEDPTRVKREFRCWITDQQGHFTSSRIEGPEGRLAENKPILLSILANVRLIKGAFKTQSGSEVSLTPRRLGDGSASFSVPSDWRVQDLGQAQFIAADPGGRYSFMAAKAQIVTPKLGVRTPGLIVLPFMSPHDALKEICVQQGIASNMQFLWVKRHSDLEAQSGAYTRGSAASIEDFLYTCDGRTGRTKGYTFGMCFYSQTGLNWSLSHFTVAGPEDQFDAYALNFANMLQSYRINEAWVATYIQQGLENVRRLQKQTMEIVTRNANEIHSMMQAAYEERQRSSDYIDYQRTNYIRGQQDWISSVEGGNIYHSDTWGLTNTATGDFYEGQPFDYVHFKGQNPKYNELMTPVDSRELWERYGR